MQWVELAVHSCPLLCPQGQLVAKLASKLFYFWSLLCNNNMATNLMLISSYDIGGLLHAIVKRRHLC